MKTFAERYVVVGPPRQGGMSEVYAAIDTQANGKRVAVKLFSRGSFEDEVLREAYDREVRALKELKHANIVGLLDHGEDSETGSPYLVLDWVEETLSVAQPGHVYEGWDSFFEELGLPILSALEFAHRRQVIHRDLKPSNILIDGLQGPKLADFSISKIKTWLAPSLTLNTFSSVPFSPPEFDDGEYTYTRDVFAFAALALQCLSATRISTHGELFQALDNTDVPHDVHAILQKALSNDPSSRQRNALVLMAELAPIYQERRKQWTPPDTYYLELTNKALSALRSEFDENGIEPLQRLLIEDLDSTAGIERYANKEPGTGDHFSLYGATVALHVALHQAGKPVFVVINASRQSSTILEKRRERALELNARFVVGAPPDVVDADRKILDLRSALEAFEREQTKVAAEFKETELFRSCSSILYAKTEVEKQKEKPLKYQGIQVDEVRALIRFTLDEPPPPELIGQQRVVNSERFRVLTGEIEDVDGNTVLLAVSKGNVQEVPRRGVLTIDIAAAREAIDRQKTALDDVRYDRSLRPELRRLLAHPEQCSPPIMKTDLSFSQGELDEAKQKAVSMAVGSTDLLLVEGPPGTGKTTFISELIVQTLRQNPNARILLTSQTHVALDNAVERLRTLAPECKMVRLGSSENLRIAPSVQDLLIDSQITAWKADVLEKGRQYLQKWASEHSIDRHQYEVATQLRLLGAHVAQEEALRIQVAALNQQAKRLPLEDDQTSQEDAALVEDELKKVNAEIKRSSSRKTELWAQLTELEPDLAELQSSSPTELDDWADAFFTKTVEYLRFEQLQRTHADWETRLGRSTDFTAALIASSQVVAGTCIGVAAVKGIREIDFDLCIVDEASKATPTETLVPMSRARRWVLVGDSKQLPPFVDDQITNGQTLNNFALDRKQLSETLFDILERQLPEANRTSLDIQHRMVPGIGNLISQCFYEGRLKSAPKEWSPLFSRLLPKPVTWLTTSSYESRKESKTGLSYSNAFEANYIVDLLRRLDASIPPEQAPQTVSVLTGYVGQKHLLTRSLASLQLKKLLVECNTVDAVQGREAFMTIYSLTRSNDDGKLGFLGEARRLNVALSRAKQYLVIVGDHTFARRLGSESPLAKVIGYMERHSNDCMIKDMKGKNE